jgi:hypothetical protein
VIDLNGAFEWLPKSTYASEAQPLIVMASKKRRGSTSIGDLLLPLMIRLGVQADNELESPSSQSVKLCQRFKRRIRQCEAHRASEIYQGGDHRTTSS